MALMLFSAFVKYGSEQNTLKRLMSGLFYRIFLRLGDVELPAGATDYRLVSRRVVDVLRAHVREHNPFLRGLVSLIGTTDHNSSLTLKLWTRHCTLAHRLVAI